MTARRAAPGVMEAQVPRHPVEMDDGDERSTSYIQVSDCMWLLLTSEKCLGLGGNRCYARLHFAILDLLSFSLCRSVLLIGPSCSR